MHILSPHLYPETLALESSCRRPKYDSWAYSAHKNYGFLRGMIQVRLLVCGCLEIDFLCCMLYASPLPPKPHWSRPKEIPTSYLPLLFLGCANFFFFSTQLNKPLFQRDRKDSLLPSLTAMCSISYNTQRHLSVVSKNCTTRFCLHAWIRFYKHNDPPPPPLPFSTKGMMNKQSH